MKANTSLLDESQMVSEKVRNAFHGISTSVNTISNVNTVVATASSEQSSVTEDISQNISSTVEIVDQNVMGIGSASKACQDVLAEAGKQKQLLAFFKTKRRYWVNKSTLKKSWQALLGYQWLHPIPESLRPKKRCHYKGLVA